MVKVTSNDMVLLFEAPDTVFDDERMADKFESDGATTSERQDRIAGTTEVGVGKSISEGAGKGPTEILLKAKVVLERDVVSLQSSGGIMMK